MAVDEYGRTIPDVGAPISPEVEASILALRNYGNAAASMPLTLAAPDPKLPGPLGYVPGAGAVEGALGTAGAAWQAGADLLNIDKGSLAHKWGLTVPDAPKFLTGPGKRFEENRAEIQAGLDKYTGGVLKQPDVNTTEGQFTDILGSATGAGIGYLPEGIAAGITRAAPYGLKTASTFLAPAVSMTGRNAPITTGLGAASIGLEVATNPELQKAEAATNDVGNTQQPPAAPTLVQVAENKVKGYTSLSDVPGFDSAISNLHLLHATPPPTGGRWQDQANAILNGETTSGDVGPTFGQQGYSGLSMAHALGALALTIGGIAIGKYTHGRLGGEITTQGRDMRFNNPDYAAQAQDYNNSVIARGGSEISPAAGQKAPVAPLPTSNKAGSLGTTFAEGTVNDAAKIQQYAILSAENPTDGQRMAHQFGNTHDTAFMSNRLESFIETGHDADRGVQIRAPKDAFTLYAGLDEAQRKIYTDALMAGHEVQGRQMNDDKPQYFPGQSTAELQAIKARAQADPEVAKAVQAYHDVVAGMIDVGEAHGFFAPAEAARLRGFTEYVPQVDRDGRLIHPYSDNIRSVYTGTSQIASEPIHSLSQHVQELYKQIRFNDDNQMLRNHQLQVQRQYPNSAQFMSDVTAPVGPHASYYATGVGSTFGTAKDPIVVVRDRNGIHHMRVEQPDIYKAMTANGMLSSRVRMGATAVARKAYQKGTTGLVSGLTGRLYAPVSAGYTSVQMGMNAPRGAYGGMLDRIVQRNLPEPVARRLSPIARGIDMVGGNQLGAAYSWAAGVDDRFMGRLANILHASSTHPANTLLRSMTDPAWVDSIAQGMKNRYLNSTTHFIKESGAGGQGSPLHMDLPGLRYSKDDTGVRSMAARVVPHAFFDGEWMGAKPYVLDVTKALGEASSHIADAGHDYFLRLNRDNPNFSKEGLVYETRNLTGNPARTGSSKAVGTANQILPYGNISAQGIARAGRAFGDHPVGTPVALATGLSMFALMELLTHMRSKEHMDAFQNQLSLQQREANVSLALSSDPTADSFFKLPQEIRAPHAFALDFWSKVINFVGARHDPATFNSVWNGIKEFLGSHVTNSNVDSIIHGAVDLGDVVNLPPFAGHIDWNQVIHGKSLVDSYSNIKNYHTPPPGQGVDAPLDSKTGQIFHDFFANGVGALATALTPVNSGVRYYNQGHPFWESMGMAGHDWLFGAKSANPQLNVIAETPMRLSTNPPIVEALRPQLGWFKQLPAMTNQDRVGYTSGPTLSRQPVPVTVDKPMSNDPLMRQMLSVAHNYGTRIERALDPIQAIQQQMAAVDKQGMDPETKRKWMNQRTREIADKYRFVESLVGDAQYTLSKLAGKTVTFGPRSNIDWQKDSSQFRQ